MLYNPNRKDFLEKLIPVFHFQEKNLIGEVKAGSPIMAKAFVEAQIWTTNREFTFHERCNLEIAEVRIGNTVSIRVPNTVRWTSVTKPVERLYKVYRNWESQKAKKVLHAMDVRLCELIAPDHLVKIKEHKLSLKFFRELNEYASTISVINM